MIYINKRRYVAEVEIKINMSDFKAELLELMYIGCMKWYTVDDRMCLY